MVCARIDLPSPSTVVVVLVEKVSNAEEDITDDPV